MVKQRNSNKKKSENDTPDFIQENLKLKVEKSEKNVKASGKNTKLQKYLLFGYMASFYDFLCDLGAFGLLRVWRKTLIERLAPSENTQLIDMAAGTGGTAFRFLDYIKKKKIEKHCHVTVCDFSEEMLEAGKAKMEASGYDPALMSWVQDDAENLKFKSDSFTAYTISYGIRHCMHYDKVLKEAYRVLKPGGKFLCLEFGHVDNIVFRCLYEIHLRFILRIFFFVATRSDYIYQEFLGSVRQFVDQETFKTMIEEAGFRHVTYENLLFGTVAIHTGIKPQNH